MPSPEASEESNESSRRQSECDFALAQCVRTYGESAALHTTAPMPSGFFSTPPGIEPTPAGTTSSALSSGCVSAARPLFVGTRSPTEHG